MVEGASYVCGSCDQQQARGTAKARGTANHQGNRLIDHCAPIACPLFIMCVLNHESESVEASRYLIVWTESRFVLCQNSIQLPTYWLGLDYRRCCSTLGPSPLGLARTVTWCMSTLPAHPCHTQSWRTKCGATATTYVIYATPAASPIGPSQTMCPFYR